MSHGTEAKGPTDKDTTMTTIPQIILTACVVIAIAVAAPIIRDGLDGTTRATMDALHSPQPVKPQLPGPAKCVSNEAVTGTTACTSIK